MRTAKASLLGSVLVASALLLLDPCRTVRADPAPLTEVEKRQINNAIDQGVVYLRGTQGPQGTWDPKPAGPHRVSYAALPGLVLLECGASPKDAAVKAAARYVRASVAHIDTTYELSLAILFLDRLGDPRDRERIQSMAVRLIVGQTSTGGWGYRCPLPNAKRTEEILVLLRKLDPPAPLGPIPGPLDLLVGRPQKDGPEPGIAGPDRRLVGLVPLLGALVGDPVRPELIHGADPQRPAEGITRTGSSPEDGTTSPGYSSGSTLTPPANPREPGSEKPAATTDREDNPPAKKPKPDQPAAPGGKNPAAKPPDAAPNAPADPKAPADPNANIVPPRLRLLPVFMDPNRLGWIDPPKRERQPTLATTDNSNSQFALLALWVAQRHDVPMKRTLGLLVRRYRTSQNLDGTWSYRYRPGGTLTTDHKPMTCVGLLGLAVGQGLAHDGRGMERPVAAGPIDPQILKGFLALGNSIGQPRGMMANQRIENLYFLWSIERVAVLYNLPALGNHDWYRWGAGILLANQAQPGCWLDGGGYHGAEPIVNTCLALLFLKRANLVKDLGKKLNVDPRLLNAHILGKGAPPAPEPPPPAPTRPDEGITKRPDPTPTPPVADKPAPTAAPAERPQPVVETTSTPEPEPPARKRWPLILLLVVSVLLLGGGLFLVLRHRKEKEDEEEKPKAKKPRAARGKKARTSS